VVCARHAGTGIREVVNSRTHLSLAKDAPTARPVQAVTDRDVMVMAFRESAGSPIAGSDRPA
jgi:hypothetical protein